MAKEAMLTTFDNPYSPFDQFTLWHLFDKERGYNTCELLARIARTSDDQTDQEKNQEIDRAIDEIIKHDPLNIYKRVFADAEEAEEQEEQEDLEGKEETSSVSDTHA